MFRRFSIVIIAALSAALVLSACGGGGTPAASGPATQSFNVDATEFQFSPKTFTAKVGEEITFNITNKGTLEHNFVVFDPSGAEIARTTVAVGATASVKVTASQAGTYPIDCDIPGHKEAGMEGTLTVTP